MEEKALATIYKYNLIEKDDNIVLGLSGGPDSMALLYVLLAAKKQIDFNLLIAHVNHGVRGEEALKDEIFVKNIAHSLDLPFFSTRVDMVALAKEEGISAEEAGRKLRYGFFREILETKESGKIAVAHNKKDQAETLLMRIMRGTGVDGLKGMEFKTDDIIRPILDIDRWEIEKYIDDEDIATVLDKTNLETIYTRNKVRLELMPYIEKNFNPKLVDTLFRLSENASLDSKFLDEYSMKRYKAILKSKDETSRVLKHDKFKREDEAIKRRVIRKAILDLTDTLQGIEEIHISSVVDLFDKKETGKRIDLPGSIIARVSYNDLIIENIKSKPRELDSAIELPYALEIGKNILEDWDLEIDIEILEKKDADFKKTSRNTRYFDYNKVMGDLFIRNRTPGDRFNPFGMEGRKKLKDYFIDEKVPREIREKLFLLVDEKNIIWVIGYRTSEIYKIGSETSKILKVEIRDIKNEEDKDGKGY